MRIVLTLLVVAGLTTGGLYGYRQWRGPATAITYKTAPVKRGTIVATVTATGAIEPVTTVLVGSQISGTVTGWYADFNQTVSQGFVLAELDQDRLEATLEQREAAVLVAKARQEQAAAHAAQARLDRQRMEDVFNRSAASSFEFDTAKTSEEAAVAGLHAAEAEVVAAEADRRLAAIELEKTVIRSPIDGIVISRNIDAGQTVAASLSAPTLFTIANDLRQMRVTAAVSETDIGKIREGSPAEFRVDAYPERRFRGVVTQVRFAETIVDNVVTYKSLIDVDNPDLALRPGMTATVLFEVARADDVLRAPNAALRFDPRAATEEGDWTRPAKGQAIRPRLFKLEAGQPREVPVDLGLNDGSFTQVKGDGLADGDAVIVEMEGGNRSSPRAAGQQRMPRAM